MISGGAVVDTLLGLELKTAHASVESFTDPVESSALSAHTRYEIFPSDVICLGASTRFMVLGLAQ